MIPFFLYKQFEVIKLEVVKLEVVLQF